MVIEKNNPFISHNYSNNIWTTNLEQGKRKYCNNSLEFKAKKERTHENCEDQMQIKCKSKKHDSFWNENVLNVTKSAPS